MNKTTFFVLPHLPCDRNLKGLCGGRTLEGVSKFGYLFTKNIALNYEVHGDITAIVSSDLPRCIETVNLCFSDTGLPLLVESGLTAIDYGDYEDKTSKELHANQLDYIVKRYPNGESFLDMVLRYQDTLDRLTEIHPNKTLLIVGHNETIPILRHLCSGIPVEEALCGDYEEHANNDSKTFYSTFSGPFTYAKQVN
ncbi:MULTISPECIES: histidine phosphatase family protein [Vibrio]|uniref:histidine phosphatase family protein n=1 Tax=Vibrio TaxID=662 RepID=UPI00142EA082|nr:MULTISPECIES: histidine phosphatase family protein [Vibrio]